MGTVGAGCGWMVFVYLIARQSIGDDTSEFISPQPEQMPRQFTVVTARLRQAGAHPGQVLHTENVMEFAWR